MQIALIGAGPRNLILTERLITYANQSSMPVTITLFDPFPIGGRVWSPEQNPTFIANTIASHATLFSDDTIPSPFGGLRGPNWFDWLRTDARAFIQTQNYTHATAFLETIDTITPNTYPARALFGAYSAWAFQQIVAHAKNHVHVEHRRVNVLALHTPATGFDLTLADGELFSADKVVLTPGQLPNEPTAEETTFESAAQTYNLVYLPVGHPGEADLEALPAEEPVIMRGLGLSFFDYMAALTIGRGGTFIREDSGTLTYQASGKEPHIIAGSRRGQLAHARGVNQKTAHVSYEPKIFTADRLTKTLPASFETFFQLIKAEMQLVYYTNLLREQPDIYTGNHAAFLQAIIDSHNVAQTVADFDFPVDYRYDWNHVFPHTTSSDAVEMSQLLKLDISDAKQGNAFGPYSASYEVVKDLRALIRKYLTAGIFDGTNYEAFLTEFGPFNNTVAVGPPLERIEQLDALIRAKVITITGPDLKVTVQDGQYQAKDQSGESWQAHALVEARLPTTNLTKVIDPLMSQLRQDEYVKTVQLPKEDGSEYQIPATDVNIQTLQVQSPKGQIDNLYIWGLPTEGKRWFTTFLPRPDDGDLNMRDAETISHTIFQNH